MTHVDHCLKAIPSVSPDLTGLTVLWNLTLFLCLLIYLLTASLFRTPGLGFAESTFSRAGRTNLACLNQRLRKPQSGVLIQSSAFLVRSPMASFYNGLSGDSLTAWQACCLPSPVLITAELLSKAGGCQNVSKGPDLLSWVTVIGGHYESDISGRMSGWGQSFPSEGLPGTFGPGRAMGFSLDFVQTWYIFLFYGPFNGTTVTEDWQKHAVVFTSMSFYWTVQWVPVTY